MSEHVLIVDDSLTVRMDLSELFSEAGFESRLCATVAEARAALSLGSLPDVVILDVVLPDGDGVEVLAHLRALPAGERVVVLMLSSEAEVKDRIRGISTGADEYVGKPYDRGFLVSRTRLLLRARRPLEAAGPAVLVIDDSPTYCEQLREALHREGYEVLVAGTGEDGLRVASDRRPSAIIVDGQLPGIDGPTVIRRLRLDAVLRGIPCLLSTASDDRGAELLALEAGADAFVRKDDELDMVLAKLGAALRGARPLGLSADTSALLTAKRILAVDDSPTYLQTLSSVLREEGYDLVLAKSGEEALALLGVQSVDCILLDLIMPGLSGEETCRRIKSTPGLRDIPLVMLTALDDQQAMIFGLGAGADDYIKKSSETDVLKARVRTQLRRKQFEDETRRIREELLRNQLEASEARAARTLAETKAALVDELEQKNAELEAFSYSVSHDLRAPLRAIDGFSSALEEDYGALLDDNGRDCLSRVRGATRRMNELIEALLDLSRVGRAPLVRSNTDLSALAWAVVAELKKREPQRNVDVSIAEGLAVRSDPRMMRALLDNLIGNAWKFSSKNPRATIALGMHEGAYVVRDNGAGFSMRYATKLFQPFQRMHDEADFVGTGIGLATVRRIVERHGGRVWAESVQGEGTSVYFTIGALE